MEVKSGVFLNLYNKRECICKKLLGVKRSTQNDFIYSELGRVPLQNKIFLSIMNYWFKILESEETRFTKNAY